MLSELLQSYQGKKVFLTGHTGFKGAWLMTWLRHLGAIVKGYSLPPDTDALYLYLDSFENDESVFADIRHADILSRELLSFQPDIIFHLAAQPLVRASYDIPTDTFDINVSGTSNLLNAVRLYGRPCRVVVTTTDKVYENQEWHYPYRESDRLGGHDPYSASKACTELVCASYKSSFFSNGSGIELVTARAGNVIGGGDMAKDRIIPDIVRALYKNESIQVRNPFSIRPWQHVLEPLNGYLELGISNQYSHGKEWDAFNFGPHNDDVLSVQQLAEIAIAKWGSGTIEYPSLSHQPHEAHLLRLDINKTISMLEWKPRLTSQEAIQWTIDWYQKAQREDKNALVLSQIKSYMELL